MGHRFNGEMAYEIAIEDPGMNTLIIYGLAYTEEATASLPRNTLMIFGKWDEDRERVTRTGDFEKEWMPSPQIKMAN